MSVNKLTLSVWQHNTAADILLRIDNVVILL